MRMSVALGVAAMLVAALVVSGVAAATDNGAMSGPHFNLNLIGVKKTDQLPNDANGGARIFVLLNGKSQIYLTKGETFDVIDADATDGRGEFMLPAPDNCYDADGNYVGAGNYRVFIRELGKPGGTATMTTCFEEKGDTTTRVCSLNEDIISLARSKGKSEFRDVTRQLTTVSYYDSVLGRNVRVDIFSDPLMDYLWEYFNTNLKIVQLRFYPIERSCPT